MDTSSQHSHTQLYIVVGLLVIFAILFFMFKTEPAALRNLPNVDTTPLELKRIILSAEQIAARKAEASDPALTAKLTITKSQKALIAKQVADPLLTATIRK